jgi:hypothetical protein
MMLDRACSFAGDFSMRDKIVYSWMLLLLLLLFGCTLAKKHAWDRKISKADEIASAVVDAVDMAPIRHKGYGPVEPLTRLALGPEGIHVDNTALLQKLWQQRISKDVRILDDDFIDAHLKETRTVLSLKGGIIPLSNLRDGAGGYLIEPLYQALIDTVTVEKALRSMYDESHTPGQLLVYIDKETTYDIVSRVLYTAGQAEYGQISFVVQGPEGPCAIPLDSPRFCTKSDPVKQQDRECAEPYLAITARGIMVRAMGGSPDPECDLVVKLLAQDPVRAEPGTQEAETASGDLSTSRDWHDRIMLGPDMACPSVPRKGDRLDQEALESLLLEVKKMAPGCKRAAIAPQPHIGWSEIVMVMDSLMGRCGFPMLQLYAGVDEEFSGCPDAMRPGG